MELKGRLGAIAKKVPCCNTIADIGTDHAYIPMYAVEKGICKKAVAADIKRGPVEIAERNIRRYELQSSIETRLGYGLDPLGADEADVIVIAGMGGIMIQEIIGAGIEKSKNTKLLILQPMNCVEILRKWLYENGFDIIEESLAEETDKIYNILCVKWMGINKMVDDFSCYIGLKLIHRKDELFRRYALKKLKLLEKKINGLKTSEKEQQGMIDEFIIIRDKVTAMIKNICVLCKDMIDFMEKIAPTRNMEDWDNTGLMIGNREKVINKILLCLDVTSDVIDDAIEKDIDMIISHHPFIFKKIDRIVCNDLKGNLIYKLIKHDICVYSAHTNLDVVNDGVNIKLAQKLCLKDIVSLKTKDYLSNNECYFGLGAVGNLKEPMSFDKFISYVKKMLDTPYLRVVGESESMIEKVAVYCGSFDDDIQAVLHHKADILITGDLKYHTAIDALGLDMCIIDAGHYNTEKSIIPHLADVISKAFREIEVYCNNVEHDPFKIY